MGFCPLFSSTNLLLRIWNAFWVLTEDSILPRAYYLDPFFLFTNRQTNKILRGRQQKNYSSPILKCMHTSCTLKCLKFSQNRIASTCPCFLTTHTVAKVAYFLLWPHTLAIFFALIFVVLRLLVCLRASIPVVFDAAIWCLQKETTIMKYIFKNRVVWTSQILVHDDIMMSVHFPTPHTPTGHVLTILVWDFFLNFCVPVFPTFQSLFFVS